MNALNINGGRGKAHILTMFSGGLAAARGEGPIDEKEGLVFIHAVEDV